MGLPSLTFGWTDGQGVVMKEFKQNIKKIIILFSFVFLISIMFFIVKDRFFGAEFSTSNYPVKPEANQNQSKDSSDVQISKPTLNVKGTEGYKDLSWKDLVQLDYQTGEKKGNLKDFENQLVKIPGYIVPLTDEYTVLDEFLFVPNDQACIHVPPPPPNLIIKSKLKEKMPFEKVYNPSWLLGKLEIVTTKSEYGEAGFKIDNAQLIKYDFEE